MIFHFSILCFLYIKSKVTRTYPKQGNDFTIRKCNQQAISTRFLSIVCHKATPTLCNDRYLIGISGKICGKHMGEETADAVTTAIVKWPNLIQINTWYNFNLIKKDPDYNKFLDCAIAAGAHYIVSEDNDFKILNTISFPKVNVIKIIELKKTLPI